MCYVLYIDKSRHKVQMFSLLQALGISHKRADHKGLNGSLRGQKLLLLKAHKKPGNTWLNSIWGFWPTFGNSREIKLANKTFINFKFVA